MMIMMEMMMMLMQDKAKKRDACKGRGLVEHLVVCKESAVLVITEVD